jgi:transposase
MLQLYHELVRDVNNLRTNQALASANKRSYTNRVSKVHELPPSVGSPRFARGTAWGAWVLPLRGGNRAVRLSAQDWSAPRIARFLGCHPITVLNDLKRWQQRRYDGLADGKAHGAPPKITPEVQAHLATWLAEDRIGTATQLQQALATQLQVHPSTLTRPLKRMG